MDFCEVSLSGRLGQDPEIKQFGDFRFAQFNVAVNERWKDKETDQWKDNTNWHRVVVKQPNLVRRTEERLSKGARVSIRGAKLVHRPYKDKKTHETRYITEVVLAGPRCVMNVETKSGGAAPAKTEEAPMPVASASNTDWAEFPDDELPF